MPVGSVGTSPALWASEWDPAPSTLHAGRVPMRHIPAGETVHFLAVCVGGGRSSMPVAVCFGTHVVHAMGPVVQQPTPPRSWRCQ